jgi:hypothetical protein
MHYHFNMISILTYIIQLPICLLLNYDKTDNLYFHFKTNPYIKNEKMINAIMINTSNIK